ncbi:MAG: TIGR02996 domain-containing protein, partial [Phycisphaerales bacterium]|nr:TIGR02996 domain-containing protein [Phycisphaerales bacterium]
MTTDDAFLAAIDDAPGDPTPRLVYADWLDDHDMPEQAELIRIEEEMAALPVFGDRFWELRPRRNELRAAAPADWLARLGYGTVCRPVFRHGWPDGWRERWRLIREFTERWHRVSMPDVGGRRAEIAEVQLRHDYPLPPSVREWIAFGCDFDRLYSGENPNNIDWLRGAAEAISIPLKLGRDGTYWGVRRADADHPDPPVNYFEFDHDAPTGFGFRVESEDQGDSLTEFACESGLWARVWEPAGGGYSTAVKDADRLSADLAAVLGGPATVGLWKVFEADDLLVLLRRCDLDDAHSLMVLLNRPLPPGRLPAVIFDRTPEWGMYRDGVF